MDPPVQADQELVLSLLSLSNGDMISGGSDGTLQLWRRHGKNGLRKIGQPIQTEQTEVWSLLMLKNGDLVSGGRDGTIRFFSPERVKEAACEEVQVLLKNPSTPAERAAKSFCSNSTLQSLLGWLN